jgi:dTDP-4-amino-4,6-dideoxygalactose transaminase
MHKMSTVGRGTAPSGLAIVTGRPAFAEPLHVGRPNLGDKSALFARISAALDRHWLTNNGPLVQEFERRICDDLGVRNCVAMSSGTTALEIAVRALGMAGEVITPAFTFVATAHALLWQGITPVFGDVDPATHNLDPAGVEDLCTDRTGGIIGVHVWGRVCDVQRLEEISRRRGLPLLFDSSHAFACSHRGQRVGGFGAAEVFSFHATKFVHCGEGGAVVTNDDALAERMRLIRNFGFAGYDNVVCLGINGKMSEVSAAMGLTSLDAMESIIAANRARHMLYADRLSGLPGLRVLEYPANERCNFQYVVLEVDETECPLTRDELLAVLNAENVLARRYFYPGCHRMEPYRSLDPDAGRRLPVTETLCRRVLQLPTGTGISAEQASTLADIVKRAMECASEIRSLLAARSNSGQA